MQRISRMAVVASAAVMGAMVVAPVPAQANATVKEILDGGATIKFTTTDRDGRRDKVRGSITFIVRSNGNWTMESNTSNSLIAWRNVTWKCDLLFGPAHSTVRYTINRHRVNGGESKKRSAGAYDADIEEFWGEIHNRGQADCGMSLG